MKIYNLGSLNIDYVYSVEHFVRAGETLASTDYKIFPGGKGLNQSVALAKAGANVIHGGIVGENADILLDTLSKAGVDISKVKTTDGPCGHAIIQVDSKGQNCIMLFSGANAKFDEAYVNELLADAKPGDLLLLQNEINGLDFIFETAHKLGLQIAFNPSPFDKKINDLPLNYVKWWLCNEIEGNELTGETDPEKIINSMSKRYPESSVLLTLGRHGSVLKNKNSVINQPIYEVKTVDTTAAGDTFTGYFLASLAKGNDEKTALDIASKASAIAVSRNGASVSIPTAQEVENFNI